MKKKEKESWTLLWVWTAYLPVKEIKWEFYVKVSDFTRCMDGIRIEQEADRKHIEQLEKENKKLKERVSELEDVSEDYDLLSKDFITLGEENERLKSDLSECECSFWFENDEVWFWKREYKRLKKWIKDHCKWYWNLFPEDEMKRQWKKADKKRK